eukprot:gene14292-20269_t
MTVPELGQLKELAGKPADAWIKHSVSLMEKGELVEAKLVVEAVSHSSDGGFPVSMLLVRACMAENSLASCAQAVSVARWALKTCKPEERAETSVALAVSLSQQSRQSCFDVEKKQMLRNEAMEVLSSAECPSGTVLQAVQLYNWAVLLAESGTHGGALSKAKEALDIASTAKATRSSSPSAVLSPTAEHATNACLILISLLLSARRQQEAALKVLSASNVGSSTSGASMFSKKASLESEVLIGRLRSRLQFAGGSHPDALSSLVHLKKDLASKHAADQGSKALVASLAEAEASIWIDLSTLFITQGEFQDAMFCVQHAAKVQAWQPATYHATGMVQEAAGELDAAVQSYNTAIALDPRHAPSLLRLGTASRRKGDSSDLALARKLLTDAKLYDPSAPGASYQLGLVARDLGHLEESEAHMHMAVKLAVSTPALPIAARAVQQDEEEAAICGNEAEEKMPPLLLWNEDLCKKCYSQGMHVQALVSAPEFEPPLRHSHRRTLNMVVATTKPSCSLLNNALRGKKQLIGSLVLPEVPMKGNSIEPSLQDRTCLIYSCGEDQGGLMMVVCQYEVAPDRAALMTKALFGRVHPQQVLVLGSLSSERYFGEGDASQETLMYVLSTAAAREAREKLGQKLPMPFLPTGNMVGGLSASILSYCQVRSIKADLVIDVVMLSSLSHLSVAPLAQACLVVLKLAASTCEQSSKDACSLLSEAGLNISAREVVVAACKAFEGGSGQGSGVYI